MSCEAAITKRDAPKWFWVFCVGSWHIWINVYDFANNILNWIFYDEKYLYFDKIRWKANPKFVPKVQWQKVSIGSGIGLAQYKQQAINLSNDDHMLQQPMTSLGYNELDHVYVDTPYLNKTLLINDALKKVILNSVYTDCYTGRELGLLE